MHLWSDPPHGHMKNSNERYLVTLLLILTGFLFESLTLMLWIAEELLSLPDFSHTCQLSLKGMHDEGNYTCRLREILRMNDTRTFPTLKSQATSWRECFFRSTSSPESSRSFNDFHDVPFGGVMKTCSVVGPFSLIRARISRIALGHFPSWQIEVNSWPNSFPLLRVWPVHSLSWWGPESLYEQDVQDGLWFLGLFFAFCCWLLDESRGFKMNRPCASEFRSFTGNPGKGGKAVKVLEFVLMKVFWRLFIIISCRCS